MQRTSGTSASLILTLEAVFTAVLARLWYHETLDRRITLAMALLTLGGMVLVFDRAQAGAAAALGLVAVMPAGIHSHRHRHQPMTHSHPHVPDKHHATCIEGGTGLTTRNYDIARRQ